LSRRPSISKAVREIRKHGLTITGVEVAPDGTIRVLTGATVSDGVDDLELARARRRARKADGTAHRH
jgi:hypothetical protein